MSIYDRANPPSPRKFQGNKKKFKDCLVRVKLRKSRRLIDKERRQNMKSVWGASDVGKAELVSVLNFFSCYYCTV